MATMICDVERRHPAHTVSANDKVEINPQGLEYVWRHGTVTEESVDALTVKLDDPVRISSFGSLNGQCRLAEETLGTINSEGVWQLYQPIDIDCIQYVFVVGAPLMFLVKDHKPQESS